MESLSPLYGSLSTCAPSAPARSNFFSAGMKSAEVPPVPLRRNADPRADSGNGRSQLPLKQTAFVITMAVSPSTPAGLGTYVILPCAAFPAHPLALLTPSSWPSPSSAAKSTLPAAARQASRAV